jgi:Uma2 family endonuclease
VTNPAVLVEVLSDSTERWERTGKFRRYGKIAALRDYVLVSQNERCIGGVLARSRRRLDVA